VVAASRKRRGRPSTRRRSGGWFESTVQYIPVYTRNAEGGVFEIGLRNTWSPRLKHIQHLHNVKGIR
jgi:hypothetical protein